MKQFWDDAYGNLTGFIEAFANSTSGVAERKEVDVAEMERLILQVMNKELKAIVWLGAGLGLIMGSINCLIFDCF